MTHTAPFYELFQQPDVAKIYMNKIPQLRHPNMSDMFWSVMLEGIRYLWNTSKELKHAQMFQD